MSIEEYNDRCVVEMPDKSCYDECKWRYVDCPGQDGKGDDQGDDACVIRHENGVCYDKCDGMNFVTCPNSSSDDGPEQYSEGYIHECI